MKKRRDFKSKLRWTRDRILGVKFLYNRGKSIVSDLFETFLAMASIKIVVAGINDFFHTNFDPSKAMMIVFPFMVLYVILGWIDFYKIHLIQKENEIAMNANPALYEKIKAILKNTKKIKKRIRYETGKQIIIH